ncbi:hypothetical protein QVD17_19517 [Tagetes erecta]|uniref:Uncharacterized protein n=1 Tax=Tagetes erecta TaxID=13708 RepID=A0AAD8KN65_TARER|nr:hypothetical protein QVD17_19517 [Tagetes erecta]
MCISRSSTCIKIQALASYRDYTYAAYGHDIEVLKRAHQLHASFSFCIMFTRYPSNDLGDQYVTIEQEKFVSSSKGNTDVGPNRSNSSNPKSDLTLNTGTNELDDALNTKMNDTKVVSTTNEALLRLKGVPDSEK